MLPWRFLPLSVSGLLVLGGCAGTLPQAADREAGRASPVHHSAHVDSAGPWAIHAVSIDLTDPGIAVSSARALGKVPAKELTSLMSVRSREADLTPVCAVNADFYTGAGYTISPHVIEGEIVQTEPGRASDSWSSRFKEQFGVTRSGRILMERLKFSGSAVLGDGLTYRIAGVNTARDGRQGITIRTHHGFGEPEAVISSELSLSAVRAGSRGDTILAVVRATRWGEEEELPQEGMVLRWDPDSVFIPKEYVEPGDTLRLWLGFDRHPDPPEVLVGGLPRIVVDGKLNPALSMEVNGPPGEFARRRHPRAGVGVSRDSTALVLITVDGRQSGSAGMTLEEFGNLMLSHGIYQGLNLDGGGSTTMVYEGAVVNSPSDSTGERAVANCLVVLKRSLSNSSKGESRSTSTGGI